MSKLHIKLLAIIILAIAIIAILRNTNQLDVSNVTTLSTPNGRVETDLTSPVSAPSIATEWQWEGVNTTLGLEGKFEESSPDIPELPFTAQSVYDALQAVKLDDQGNVILDHDALISLDEALERIYNQLDDASAATLRELIESALPGKAGEQTAELVDKYRQFLRAKEEFSQMYEHTANASSETTLQSLNSDQRLYSELQDLREVYLGREASVALFNVSDANAEYMFESMKLSLNPNLSPDEVAARQIELEKLLRQQTEPDSTIE